MAINIEEKYTAKFKNGSVLNVAAPNYKLASNLLWEYLQDNPDKVRINSVNYVEDISVSDGVNPPVPVTVSVKDNAGQTIPEPTINLYGLTAGPNTVVSAGDPLVIIGACNPDGASGGITATLWNVTDPNTHVPVPNFNPVDGHNGQWQATVYPTGLPESYEVRFDDIPVPAGVVPVTGILFDGTEGSIAPPINIDTDDQIPVRAVVQPDNATNKNIRYVSSNPAWLQVSAPNPDGVVDLFSPEGNGVVILFAVTEDGAFTVLKNITIIPH